MKIDKLICRMFGHKRKTIILANQKCRFEDVDCRYKCERCGKDLGKGTHFVLIYEPESKDTGTGDMVIE